MKIKIDSIEDQGNFKQEICFIAKRLGISEKRIRISIDHPVGEDVIFIDDVYNGYLDSTFYGWMFLDHDPYGEFSDWVAEWKLK